MYCRVVKLRIVTWREEQFGLFDYRSQPYEDMQFRSNMYKFPLPSPNSFVFYFIHQSTLKSSNQPFMFERRKNLQSNVQKLTDRIHYSLVGGFKLEYREERDRRGVFVTLINLKDISVKSVKVVENTLSGSQPPRRQLHQSLPFWVVRTLTHWKLKEDQVIKFGRLQLKVEQECADPQLRRWQDLEAGEVLNLDEKYEEYSHIPRENEEEKRCRVCYESTEEGRNILINPCLCRGSIQYIHLECLRQWLESRMTKVSLETGGNIKVANKNCCQLCKMRFPTRIIKNGVELALISFLEQDNPFVCFAPLGMDIDRFYVTFGEESQVKIGRLEDSGLFLADQTVSRKHAILKIEDGACLLKDQESKYGTLAYQKDLVVKLGYKLKAFQILNSAYCFTFE